MSEHGPIPAELDGIGRAIVDGAFQVHRHLGPGLLESVYEICLMHELTKSGLVCKRQIPVPIAYDGIKLDAGFRVDLLVNDSVIVEIKSADTMNPVFEAQLLTYLKLTGFRLGYLINFNVTLIKNGIRRRVL